MHPLPASQSPNPELVINDILGAMRAVLGIPTGPLALHEPEFDGREWEYVKECLDTGWVSSVGQYVDRFEQDLAHYTGSRYAIATSNGTSALHVSLLLSGIKPGDEVLLPTLTFVATANAVAYISATPHFVDSETTSLGIDAKKLESHLNETATITNGICINKRTGARIRALVVMHVFGHPSDIEDAAESLGSSYHGKHTGNFGLLSALSFNGNKVITTGGGGAILTNDPVLAKRAKHLTTTARTSHHWAFIHDEIGFNYRLPNLNAALGCAQLERLPSMLVRKRILAERYQKAFVAIKGAKILVEPQGAVSNYWLNAIVLNDEVAGIRDQILTALNAAGYISRPIWTLMHKLPMYQGCPRSDLEVAESLEGSVINIPSSAKLAD